MRLPTEVLIFDHERRRMPQRLARRAWFRPARAVPPEAIFLAVCMLVALAGWLAVAPARPAAPASTTDVARCADAAKPCRGRA